VNGPTTRLRLRVIPGAGRTGVDGRYGEAWKLRVAAAPERGRANDAVLDLLGDALGVPRASMELVAGHAGRDKVVAINGLSFREAEARLGARSAERVAPR
jgi:hypothetical protein